MTDKTPELAALESMQELINNLPDERRRDVMFCVEEIRDLMTEHQGDGVLAVTLIACEYAAMNAEIELGEQADDSIVAG